MAFDVAERVRQVREVDDMIKKLEGEFEEKIRGLRVFSQQARSELLAYLLETGQKSANTAHGVIHWSPRVTYRVIDKETFRQHVVENNAWELITWRAADSACEAVTEETQLPPPGLYRNAVNVLTVSPPKPPHKRTTKSNGDNGSTEEVKGEWDSD